MLGKTPDLCWTAANAANVPAYLEATIDPAVHGDSDRDRGRTASPVRSERSGRSVVSLVWLEESFVRPYVIPIWNRSNP